VILQLLTGKPEVGCRALIGRLLKPLKDDCAVAYALLLDAQSLRPADPVAWLMAATQARAGPRESHGERLRRELEASADPGWANGSVVH
jgi:hypothetical protein